MKTICACLLACCFTATSAPFQNLGFENANTNNLTSAGQGPGYVIGTGSRADLLPAWNLALGQNPVTTLQLNEWPVGGGSFSTIFGPELKGRLGFNVVGKYALYLHYESSPPHVLRQSGDVPSDAGYFAYKYQGAPFQVSVNGDILLPEGTGMYSPASAETSLFFNVSRFAGQNVELSLTILGSTPIFGGPVMGGGYYDGLGFVVPEPSTLVFSGVGILLVLARCWWRRRS